MSQLNMLLPVDTSKPLPPVKLEEPQALEPVANVESELEERVKQLLLRPLNDNDQKLAVKWAKDLIPADPSEPSDFINLGADELADLTAAASNMLDTLTYGDLRKVKVAADVLYKTMDRIDVSKLSPKVQKKWLGIKETVQDVIDRISAVITDYKNVEGDLQKQAAGIIQLRDTHIERKNQADTIGKEARASRNVLRVVAEACKLYLLQSGYPDQEKYEDEVILDAAEAKRLNRALDETLTDKVTAHKNYLIMVEGYLATVEGAIVDAAQSAVSLDMLEQNERVIAQGLNNLVVFTIPAWQRMIASAYIAAMSEQAADFIEEQNEKTNQFRKQTADILQLSFQAFARMINSTGFDDESMEYLTAVLAEGFRVITDAATQAEKAHDVSRVKQDAMMTKVQEAQRSFGTSNVKHSKKK